jgi:hypothetical protein
MSTYIDEDVCPRCAPLGCECSDAERPEAFPAEYRTPGCHCNADFDGGDCMCFEFDD